MLLASKADNDERGLSRDDGEKLVEHLIGNDSVVFRLLGIIFIVRYAIEDDEVILREVGLDVGGELSAWRCSDGEVGHFGKRQSPVKTSYPAILHHGVRCAKDRDPQRWISRQADKDPFSLKRVIHQSREVPTCLRRTYWAPSTSRSTRRTSNAGQPERGRHRPFISAALRHIRVASASPARRPRAILCRGRLRRLA